jgi:hypothetical protein
MLKRRNVSWKGTVQNLGWLAFFLAWLFLMPCYSQTKSLEQGALRIEISLEQLANKAWAVADPGLVFPPNAFVRFRIQTNFEGYIYVINYSTQGRHTLLFPREETGTQNRIEAGKEYTIPAVEGGYKVTGPPGHEIVYWLISPVELQPDSDWAKFAHQPLPPPPDKKLPANLIPRCDDKIFRARGECVDNSAGPQQMGNADTLPENLAGLKGAAARELEFSRQQQSTLISAPKTASEPVIFEFHLAHR